ncbi:MAG: DnaB-like helicase C-terminal domain-containing protein [Kiritimatiellia bacterium]|jgi:replicative DNA helicase|nr:DnaB-like helicase C-terminal domain-containing protein [Kiritimatiellia bacterium]MDD4440484.1 DnaB-like helicase C-terminal domain-containing protein [Kiritimatiellia bacterium]
MDYQAIDFVLLDIPTGTPVENSGLQPLPTGVKELDVRIDGGMRAGAVYRLSGRPTAGKTWCALTITRCAALGENLDGQPLKNDHNRPHPVLYFTFELSKQDFVQKLLCGSSEIAECGGIQGETDVRILAEPILRHVTKLSRAPIFVEDTAPLDVSDIWSRSSRMKERHGIELVIIDYLQLCSCRESISLGRRAETSDILRQLAKMAQELHLAVIVVEQT